MTRSNLYVTLSNGKQLICVADSSSAPEQGYIVECLFLPLLTLNSAEKEIALLAEHCTMNELRINASYRYAINLCTKRIKFFEEKYNEGSDTFSIGDELTDRYTDYLKKETELETAIKTRFRHYSNKSLIERANSMPDFKWDDEGVELQRRRRISNGSFNYAMYGNKLVILFDEMHHNL